MFKFLFKSKFLGFVKAPVGVLSYSDVITMRLDYNFGCFVVGVVVFVGM